MKKNIFMWAFEAAFKDLDLSKDEDGRYANPYTQSIYSTYIDSINMKYEHKTCRYRESKHIPESR